MWNFDKLQEQEKERRLFHLRLALLIIMVAALLLVSSGCSSLVAKLQALEGQPAVDQGVPDLATGNLSNPPPQAQQTKVTVYFKDQQGRYLVPTAIEVDKAPVSVTLIQPTAVDTPYPEHAANYLSQEPKLPTPMIEPEKVAAAILDAATSPTEAIRVGAIDVHTPVYGSSSRSRSALLSAVRLATSARIAWPL